MAPIIRTCKLALAAFAALAVQAPAPASAQEALGAYLRARAADADGAAQLAASGYARALAEAPDDAQIALRAYRQGLAVGDYVLASRAAAVLVRSGSAPPDTALLALAVALRTGDNRAAGAAVERLRRGPLDFLAPPLAAWLAFDRGEDAVALLDANPGSALSRRYAQRQRALLLIASRRTAEGMAALAPQLRADGGDDLRIDAALLLGQTGARDRARALLAGDAPDYAALRKRLGKGKATASIGAARLLLGVAAEIAGEDMPTLSILLMRAALLLDPGEDRARIYLAEALSQDGSTDAALAVLAEIDRRSPFAGAAATTEIAVLRRGGRDAAALAHAAMLAQRPGAGSDDLRAYGDLLADLGRFDDAAAAYQRAQALAANDGGWMLHYLRGTALDRAGRWAEAQPALERAVALAPDEAEPLQYLGAAQARHGGNLTRARWLLERARDLEPEDGAIAGALGWIYYRGGDLARAVPLLEKAVRAEPASIEGNEQLGDAYWRLGRHYEARYAWRAAALQAGTDAAARLEAKLAGGLAPAQP